MAGYFDHLTAKFVYMEEMEPELVVPDLTDFKVDGFLFIRVLHFSSFPVFQLKPYVSYNVTEIKQDQFLARHLFNATYAQSIADEFKRGEIKPINDDEEEEGEWEKTDASSTSIK